MEKVPPLAAARFPAPTFPFDFKLDATNLTPEWAGVAPAPRIVHMADTTGRGAGVRVHRVALLGNYAFPGLFLLRREALGELALAPLGGLSS